MGSPTYQQRRGQIANYFDRTAADAWSRMTSDAPLGRIRSTVRAGRTRMRETLLGWLPADLTGRRVLDAGCGTGTVAVELARRGAEVIAVDLSPTLIELAHERMPADLGPGRIEFLVGDLLDPSYGRFDHVLAMDSLIHYQAEDALRVIGGLAARTDGSMVLTFAPRTALLALMHMVGRIFPKGDRAPAIEPIAEPTLRNLIAADESLAGWQVARTERVISGFYTSQAIELLPK
ncbi:magnesium protoporphyrin IX methyltransferase [Thiococcus pfennigii]|jgi:magnesium-protoporphyrin O-methyltransferase|uniref:magnesium protoporphyrin IX methyltransferase n=1 Tax=Thiococcus pfennigii TaxID=1057 RepID=UPI0019088697|nr:magnesium protoporphyrin IX methyltransferase [Thiococcus pfennigii]MBK1701579.1 magnesium protoporphyrin IX methyltransferase [Thiococcus pfennigii]MBK1733622.1 magnesium protoporphyrin IX methyltransferase [Thiococcus pfennigii]